MNILRAIPGSRLFNKIFRSSSRWKEYHEIFGYNPKRLPSRLTSQQLVRIDVNAYLRVIWKRKAIDYFSDRSRELEDGARTQQDLEPVKPFHSFDLSGDNGMKRHRCINLFAQTAMECLRREFR